MKKPEFLIRSASGFGWKPAIVLLAGLILTVAGVLYTDYDFEKETRKELQYVCSDIRGKILGRLNEHAQLLKSGAALFAATDSVTREDWKNFYNKSGIKKNLPGIQGMGFSLIIPAKELQHHMAAMKKDGFPEYKIWPLRDRDFYTSTIYLEPFTGRNLRAFGFDMFSEPVRRKAMEIARDSNITSLSGKVTLVQETDKDVQAGTLIFVPVYKNYSPTSTVEERRKAIKGWVYSPYRMNDLMEGVLGRWDQTQKGRILLEVYDGERVSEESQLFKSQNNDTLNKPEGLLRTLNLPLEFNGKKWTLIFTQSGLVHSFYKGNRLLVLISGIIISLLLFILSWLLLHTRLRAQQIAGKLTGDLKQIRLNYETFFNTIDEFLFVLDQEGNIIHTNDTVIKRLAYTREELSGQSVLMVHPPERRAEAGRIVGEMLEGKAEFCPVPIVTKSGMQIPVETRVSHGFWDGKPVIFGVTKDIAQIKLSEEKFSKLFYINPSACGLSDLATGKYIEVNNVFYTLFGFNKEEVIGKTAFELGIFSKEVRSSILLQSDSNGNIYNAEVDLKTKYGETKHVLMSAESIFVQDKTFRFTVVHDITDRKKAEKALQDSNKKLEAIILASPDGIGMVGLDGKLQLVSDRLAEMYGFSSGHKEFFLGKSIYDFIDPSNHHLLYENIKSLLIDKKDNGLSEYIGIKKDGSHFYVDVNSTVMCDSEGKPENILFVERDITERKQNENKIRQTSTRLSLATRAGGVGIWDWDLVNDKMLWDDQMFTLYGISRKDTDAAFEIWRASLHPDEVALRTKEIQMAISGDKEFDTEFRVVWPDGSIHNIRANAIVQRDNTGKPVRMIGTNWDITEQKKTEAALRQAKMDADMANKAKSEFLANMSHEIRTPMNAILGFSEALYHKLESKQHQRMVKSILSSGNLLMSLLNDILDLSKIEAGKLDILLQPVNLNNVLQEMMLLFREKAKAKNLELKTEVGPDFPAAVMLDEIRIKQVLFNLVGNAIKFTHTGFVCVRVNFRSISDQNGALDIEVEDTGIGIPESQLEIIFEAFRQQSGQSNRQYGGTGLGLAISRRLVEKMNGMISVNSHEGSGSVFRVVFPGIKISNVFVHDTEYNDEIQNVVFEKSEIMVVDDVLTNLETIENLLSSSGLSVISATSGAIALELLEHSNPSLILLDIRMSEIDGFEVAKRIKLKPETMDIPIIAFTASVMSSGKIENYSAFDGVLYKPVKRTDLFNLLKKHLKYTSEQNTSTERGFKIDNLDSLPPEVLEKLPEIVQILENKFIPRWMEIKDSFILYTIESFAEDLKTFGIKYNFGYLIDYSTRIRDSVEMVELESISLSLLEFPKIIKKLSGIIKK
jgi:PAS domain S-box-containing protein